MILFIGHGLENDLRALKILHSRVIDTSLVFPHFYGLPYRETRLFIPHKKPHGIKTSFENGSFSIIFELLVVKDVSLGEA